MKTVNGVPEYSGSIVSVICLLNCDHACVTGTFCLCETTMFCAKQVQSTSAEGYHHAHITILSVIGRYEKLSMSGARDFIETYGLCVLAGDRALGDYQCTVVSISADQGHKIWLGSPCLYHRICLPPLEFNVYMHMYIDPSSTSVLALGLPSFFLKSPINQRKFRPRKKSYSPLLFFLIVYKIFFGWKITYMYIVRVLTWWAQRRARVASEVDTSQICIDIAKYARCTRCF